MILARYALRVRMAQKEQISVEKSADDAYTHALNFARSQFERLPADYPTWVIENKDFLMGLSMAMVLKLDANASKVPAQVREVRPPAPGKIHRSGPVNAAQPKLVTPPLGDQRQAATSSYREALTSLVPRFDPLVAVMRDKVQLLHMLAEYQEEQDKEVTGEFLEPFTKSTIADAARLAAMVARREYYFRPHGPVAAHWLEWEVENALLDEYSEKALLVEVLEEIEQLKTTVDDLRPKRERW